MKSNMKKVFLMLALTLLTCGVFAQEDQEYQNLVSISPFRLWNGLRVKYERPLNNKVTYGGIVTYYYGRFPGIQVAPIARLYFKGNAPAGFYAQGKVVGGYYSRPASFASFGGGAALGYQVLRGKSKRWTIDMNLGIKAITFDDGGVTDSSRRTWYLTGPGSIVDGLISIGYRF